MAKIADSPPRKVAKSNSANNLNDKVGMSSGSVSNDLRSDFPVLAMSSNYISNNNNNNENNELNYATKIVSINNNSNNINNNKNNNNVNNNSNINKNNNINKKQQVNSIRKKALQAANSTIFEVRDQLVTANKNDFTVKPAKKSGPVKITIAGHEQIANAKNALVSAGVNFHEFLSANEKRKCYIIRGLVGTTADDLPFMKNDLVCAGLPETIEVALHETGYIRANKNSNINKPVKLIIPPNIDIKVLDSIRTLNHVVIRFEEFKSKTIVQCKNCQRFRHSAAGCQHEHRCVKCKSF